VPRIPFETALVSIRMVESSLGATLHGLRHAMKGVG
jgi:hypothetical protein